MSAPKVYGLILGLTIVATAGVETASSAGRQAVAAASDETWTIPGAASIAGLNSTRFVSDLALTNLGSSTANVIVSFVGPGDLPPKPITLAAGATTVYRNVLDALWAASGLVGALSVRSDQPLVLRARTYNTAATGTFGVALPVYASGQLLAEGQTADSFWVQQDPSGSSGFRTNVGVVFPDAGGGDAVVTFYDASGGVVGTLNYSSASAGFQQLSIASVAPAGLLVGRAQISVTRGRAAGYAVGADNVTGDTSLYPFEALPAGVQDVVVNGVARLNGRNNTFFRTDARFYNPTPSDVTVTLRFHAAGAANPTPQSATLNLPAGRIVEVVDVLGTILSAPVGSGGAVRFTADQPVAILCRTSNVDPQGVQPGTFGAQQHPVPLASFLSSADAGAVVTAIRQDASFRTNVGFTAGADGASYRLTLKSAQGTAIATAAGSLGAFGWTQASVADLFPGTAIPADATLLVEVTSGTVDVYDASADNASGDLVVTPIAPVPAAIPSSAVIGPAGGSIRSADGRLTLKVPDGALAAATTLSIAPVANDAPNAIGSAYALSPVGVAFARPAQLVLAYSAADLDGTGDGALGIASQEGSDWFAILGGSVDPVTRTLRVPVTSTSPGHTSAGNGRLPQRATQNGNLGPYGSATLNPAKAAVLVGKTKSLKVTVVGPSSTSGSAAVLSMLHPGGLAQNVLVTWYVNRFQFGNGTVGTLIPSPGPAAPDAVYHAPSCPPPTNPVRVDANVLVQTSLTTVSSVIRIIEKDWRIVVTYRSQSLCGFKAAWTLDYSRSHDGAFSIDEQLQVTDYLAGLTHQNTTTPAWCPGFGEDCTQPTLESPIGDLILNDVTGRLIDDYFLLTVNASVPGTGARITFQCGEGTFVEPVPHGAP
ncbi:MAG TPA: hypothetical protein VGK70_09970, partial [Thermoanaerobaculia bacterium]